MTIDIPKDDVECIEKYPKYKWVYDTSRVLDAQNVKWSIFKSENMSKMIQNIHIETSEPLEYHPGYIYVDNNYSNEILSEVFIVKGEIRLLKHYEYPDFVESTKSLGNVELRIGAFVTMHFQKFTGVISVTSCGSDIYSIRLKPQSDYSLETNSEIAKLIKRIYKKNDVSHISGLTDHTLHESTAS